MTFIFVEGNKCNNIDIKKLRPYEDTHKEPSREDFLVADLLVKNHILKYINSRNFTNKFIKQLFRYRVKTRESLVQNFVEFFSIILKKKSCFVYSPNKGIAFWPLELGFVRDEYLEQHFKNKEHVFFGDFITETTTFLRFHFKFRFYNLINKKRFLKHCIDDILYFASLENRFHLMRDVIFVALNMINN